VPRRDEGDAPRRLQLEARRVDRLQSAEVAARRRRREGRDGTPARRGRRSRRTA